MLAGRIHALEIATEQAHVGKRRCAISRGELQDLRHLPPVAASYTNERDLQSETKPYIPTRILASGGNDSDASRKLA